MCVGGHAPFSLPYPHSPTQLVGHPLVLPNVAGSGMPPSTPQSTPGRVMGFLGSAVKASIGYLRKGSGEAVIGLAWTAELELLVLTSRVLECWKFSTKGEHMQQVSPHPSPQQGKSETSRKKGTLPVQVPRISAPCRTL